MQDILHPLTSPGNKRALFNAACFQIGWFACVLGGDLLAIGVTAIILLAHSQLIMQAKKEWGLLLLTALLGIALDTMWVATGVLEFDPSTIFVPLWLVCLWIVFSTTLSHSMAWLQQRLLLAALLGAVAGPASYLAGAGLANVTIVEPAVQSIALIALAWSILFPLLLFVARGIGDE